MALDLNESIILAIISGHLRKWQKALSKSSDQFLSTIFCHMQFIYNEVLYVYVICLE